MAAATATITDDNYGGVLIVWATVGDNTTPGDSVDVGKYGEMFVHSDGNYGSGASVAMQGSNNNVAWVPLGDTVDGTAIALTADTVGTGILGNPKYIRPVGDAAGDSNTAIVVTVHARKLLRY